MKHAARWLMAIGMIALNGCGEGDRVERFLSDTEPANLRDPDMTAAVSLYSDPRVLLAASNILAGQALRLSRDGSDGCPTLIDASDAQAGVADWRLEGSCTSSIETTTYRYRGVIEARGSGSSTEIRYRDVLLARSRPDACDGLEEVTRADGVVQLPFLVMPSQDGSGESEPIDLPVERPFELRGLFSTELIDHEACTVESIETAYDLSGTFRQERKPDDPYSHENVVYTLEGRAAVRGGPFPPQYRMDVPDGAWVIAADDYAFAAGGWCEGPVGGTLRLEAGDDEVVLHGDAALSCDGAWAPCARWSLNGVDQPAALCDMAMRHDGCAAGPETPLPWATLVLLLAGLLWERRRRRRA